MILKLFLALNILTLFQPFISQEIPIHHPNPKLKVYIQTIQKKEFGYRYQKEQRKLHFMSKQKIQKPSCSGYSNRNSNLDRKKAYWI